MVYMYHSFLIHSSADGHLGCFHVLAMINSAAMNIGVHVSLSDLLMHVLKNTFLKSVHYLEYLCLISAFVFMIQIILCLTCF